MWDLDHAPEPLDLRRVARVACPQPRPPSGCGLNRMRDLAGAYPCILCWLSGRQLHVTNMSAAPSAPQAPGQAHGYGALTVDGRQSAQEEL